MLILQFRIDFAISYQFPSAFCLLTGGFSKPTIGLVMVETLSCMLPLISDCPGNAMACQVSIDHLSNTITLQVSLAW